MGESSQTTPAGFLRAPSVRDPRWLLLLVPSLLFLGLQLRTVSYDFVWTDHAEIEHGTLIRPPAELMLAFVEPMHRGLDFRWEGVRQPYYRPLQRDRCEPRPRGRGRASRCIPHRLPCGRRRCDCTLHRLRVDGARTCRTGALRGARRCLPPGRHRGLRLDLRDVAGAQRSFRCCRVCSPGWPRCGPRGQSAPGPGVLRRGSPSCSRCSRTRTAP